MAEISIVIRCLFFSALIILLSKMEIQNETVETRALKFLYSSDVAIFLKHTAEGGAHLIQKKTAQWRGDTTELLGGK
jgi:hypothetical protein